MREVGRRLQQSRLEQGLSIEEMQERTKIRSQYLAAIEDGEWSVLPGKFYAKMFIKTYAEALGLPANELLSQIKEEIDHNSGLSSSTTAIPADDGTPAWLVRLKNKLPMILTWTFVVVLMIVVYSWLSGSDSETSSTEAVATQRVTTIGQENAEQVWQVQTVSPVESSQPLETPILQESMLSPSPTIGMENMTGDSNVLVNNQVYSYIQDGMMSDESRARGTIEAQSITNGVETYAITNAEQIHATIRITGEASWTEIRTGSRKGSKIKLGKEVFTQGDFVDVKLAKSIWIRLGDPSSAELIVNGQGISLGSDKKPRTIAFLIGNTQVIEEEQINATETELQMNALE